MIATLLSILTSLLLLIYPFSGSSQGPELSQVSEISHILIFFLSSTLILVAVLSIFAKTFISTQSLSSLQKAEQSFTSHILEMFTKDSHLRLIQSGIHIFAFLSFAIAIYLLLSQGTYLKQLTAIWLISFGITVDLFHSFLSRITTYLNPFASIKMFGQEGIKAIQYENDKNLDEWIDALSEIAIKAIQRLSPSLANKAIDHIQHLGKAFLESPKRLPQKTKESQVSYHLYYLFQQIEFIWNKALKSDLEVICSHIITVMSKLVVYSAKYDITMTSHPLYFIHKFIKESQQANMPDISVKASLALLEVSRVIGTELDITYTNLQETFFNIISQLEEIAKETFRQDKTVNIQILTQPFKELKELFSTEKLSQHEDRLVIVADIDRVLGEFNALELVMKTIPPIPTFDNETVAGHS